MATTNTGLLGDEAPEQNSREFLLFVHMLVQEGNELEPSNAEHLEIIKRAYRLRGGDNASHVAGMVMKHIKTQCGGSAHSALRMVRLLMPPSETAVFDPIITVRGEVAQRGEYASYQEYLAGCELSVFCNIVLGLGVMQYFETLYSHQQQLVTKSKGEQQTYFGASGRTKEVSGIGPASEGGY